MKFGSFPLSDAVGVVLAHRIVTPSHNLPKGHALTPDDIKALAAHHITDITGAKLADDDVEEDAAAKRLADSVCGTGCASTKPFTGRANLVSLEAGVLTVTTDAVDRINRIDESITLATLAQHSKVAPRQTIATAKIIPFACRTADLERAEEIANADAPVLAVSPFRQKKIALISTTLPETKTSVLDKSTAVLGDRLRDCKNQLSQEIRCNHDASTLSVNIKKCVEDGVDLILIFGASAITDRGDIIPSAIEASSGAVDHLGMPVDPGNLLLLAHIGRVQVIGLPGCARSPKLNGFDWILERLLADLPVTRDDIMGMGVGGLLKEIPSRPQPREENVRDIDHPKLAAIILAAGQSRRMGQSNKLLEDIDGKPMVRHAADAVVQSAFDKTIVVTGHEEDQIRHVLSDLPVSFTHNTDFEQGLSSSLKAGVAALRKIAPEIDGVMVCLGDMPRISGVHLSAMKSAFDPNKGARIVVPTHLGKRGNPVIWGRDFFDEIMELKGDVGARSLIGPHEENVVDVPLDTDAIFLDIDTPQALAAQRSSEK